MNVQKQAGAVDCALYAIATVTCLLLGHDPKSVVFNQKVISETVRSEYFIVVSGREKSPTSTKNHQNTGMFCFLHNYADYLTMVKCLVINVRNGFISHVVTSLKHLIQKHGFVMVI